MGIDPLPLLGWKHPLTHRQFEALAAFEDGSWAEVDALPVPEVQEAADDPMVNAKAAIKQWVTALGGAEEKTQRRKDWLAKLPARARDMWGI